MQYYVHPSFTVSKHSFSSRYHELESLRVSRELRAEIQEVGFLSTAAFVYKLAGTCKFPANVAVSMDCFVPAMVGAIDLIVAVVGRKIRSSPFHGHRQQHTS